MAKPGATHVIEIETGIGEPAFIPLTLGEELSPISVGRKGMWKIESARVLDVHAFVYFDGTSLFLQSADEQTAASVDGVKVGKTWTELHAPCKIDVGTARLRFRSLLRNATDDDDVLTTAHAKAPVAPPPAAAPRPAAGAPPEAAPSKPQRPFKPGEFSTPADEEATRLAPVDAIRPTPRPAAGRPPESDHDVGTRTEGSGRSRRPPPAAPSFPPQDVTAGMVGAPVKLQPPPMYPAPAPSSAPMMHPMGAVPPGSVVGTMPPGSMGPAIAPGTMSGVMPSGFTQHTMPPGQPQPMTMPMPMHGYGAQPPAAAPPAAGGDILAQYNNLSLPKKILVVLAPFCVLAAAYLIFADGGVPSAKTTTKTSADGGAASALPSTTPTPSSSPSTNNSAPAPSPCPAGYVPLPGYAVTPGGAIPCIPAAAPTVSDAPPPAATTTAPPSPPGQRTLERQAVDYVAVGDYAHAAAAYEELLRKNPDNRVYAEAARILRAKVDGGAP